MTIVLIGNCDEVSDKNNVLGLLNACMRTFKSSVFTNHPWRNINVSSSHSPYYMRMHVYSTANLKMWWFLKILDPPNHPILSFYSNKPKDEQRMFKHIQLLGPCLHVVLVIRGFLKIGNPQSCGWFITQNYWYKGWFRGYPQLLRSHLISTNIIRY